MGGKGGGSTTTNTYDPEYNAGMLELSEEQQSWARELFNVYQHGQGSFQDNSAEYNKWNDGLDQAKVRDKITGGHSAEDKFRENNPEPNEQNWVADNPNNTSYADFEQQKLNQNAGMMPYHDNLAKTDATLKWGQNLNDWNMLDDELSYKEDKIDLDRSQMRSDKGLIRPRAEREASDIRLGINQNRAANELMPHQTSNELNRLDLDNTQMAADKGMVGRETYLRGDNIKTSVAANQQLRHMMPHESYARKSTLGLQNAQNAADRSMIPQETYLRGDNIKTDVARNQQTRQLMPHETYNKISNYKLNNAQNQDAHKQMRERAPVVSEYYKQALKGEDVNAAANTAAADATHAMKGMEQSGRMSAARMGLNPNSGRFNTSSIDRAKAIGAARTAGRNEAKNNNFNKLQGSVGMGVR